MSEVRFFTDFKLGDRYLSEFNGVIHCTDGWNSTLAPSLEHVTEKIPSVHGELHLKSMYQPRIIEIPIFIQDDIDINEFTAWICKNKPQKFNYVGDNKVIDVIYDGLIDIENFYDDGYKGLMNLVFIAHDPFWRLKDESSFIFNEPVINNKIKFLAKCNTESYPVIKITPNGTQSRINFKWNNENIVLQQVDKDIYIDCEEEEVYEIIAGQKKLVMEKFFSNAYYDMCVFEPFVENTFELISGSIKKIEIKPNWRII